MWSALHAAALQAAGISGLTFNGAIIAAANAIVGPGNRTVNEAAIALAQSITGESSMSGPAAWLMMHADRVQDGFFATTVGAGWYAGNITPAAQYFPALDMTLFAWLASLDGGTTTVIRVKAYYHATGNWTAEVTAGTETLVDVTDTHDVPAIWQDDEGHFFVSYGSHNSAQRLASSRYPNDPVSWVAQTSFGSDLTYPNPHQVGDICFHFSRSNSRLCRVTPITSAGGVSTAGTPVDIIDFGVATRFYRGSGFTHGSDIHFVACRADSADDERKHVYYFIANIVAGVIASVSNFAGTTAVLAASFPIDTTLANSDFRIYTHTGSDDWTMGPQLCLDSNDHPHVLFSAGAVEPGSDPNDFGDLLHMWNDGTPAVPGDWSAPDVVVANTYQTVAVGDVVPAADGTVEIWWPFDDGSVWAGAAGNAYRAIWTPSGGVGSAVLIRQATDFALGGFHKVRDGHADARLIFREVATTSPDDYGSLKAFAHGDSGYLRRGTGYVFDNAEAEAYIARLSVAPSADEKFLVDRLFSALIEIGVAKFDVVQLYCMGATEADALINILSESFGATNQGATFEAGRGFTSDGVSTYVDTGFDPTLGTAFTQDSAHFGVICATAAGTVSGSGWLDGTDGTVVVPRNTSNNCVFALNQASAFTSTAANPGDGLGLYLANRSASNATQFYRKGEALTVTGNANQTSAALNSVNFRMGQHMASAFSAREWAGMIAGGSLTASEAAILYHKGLAPLLAYKELV